MLGRKILVISDSHGKLDNVEKAISAFGHRGRELEMLIHLGDSQGDMERIESMVNCPVYAVKGNCDFSVLLPGTQFVMIGDEKAMITHGHRYGCKSSTDQLVELARENGASIVMFGHTHIPMLDLSSDVKVMNPGSISEPRQPGRRPTYLVITIEEDGRKQFVHVTM